MTLTSEQNGARRRCALIRKCPEPRPWRRRGPWSATRSDSLPLRAALSLSSARLFEAAALFSTAAAQKKERVKGRAERKKGYPIRRCKKWTLLSRWFSVSLGRTCSPRRRQHVRCALCVSRHGKTRFRYVFRVLFGFFAFFGHLNRYHGIKLQSSNYTARRSQKQKQSQISNNRSQCNPEALSESRTPKVAR